MPCDFPLKGYRPANHEPALTFNPLKALNSSNPLVIPCGRCTGCRLDRSRNWAVRCMHESELYEQNCFITLTYDDEHLPKNYSVSVRELQLFIKRLRKSLPHKIRFYACGEYGEKNLRPHYHALIFNHDFYPKTLWSNQRGQKLYTSPTLSKIWPYGLATLGNVTFESAAYVARYVMKKIGGDLAADHYRRVHPLTQQIHTVHPEFAVMSRRPGIGMGWLEKYRPDVYPSDFLIVRGQKMRPPRFYDNQLTEEELEKIKRRRKAAGLRFKPDQKPERLRARAAVRDSRISTLKRKLDDNQ